MSYGDRFGNDLYIGASLALSDDINPVHDNRDDGWWSGIMSFIGFFELCLLRVRIFVRRNTNL